MSAFPPVLESYRAAPIWELQSTAMLMRGHHANDVWRGLAGKPGSIDTGVSMVVKRLDTQTSLSIELGCALAAQALDLDVPRPGIVIASSSDLPNHTGGSLPDSILLFGSELKYSAGLIAEPSGLSNDNDHVWDRICKTKTSCRGAAWDELVANDDRHSSNFLFDGIKWWLFDHDRALQPLMSVSSAAAWESEKDNLLKHTAARNTLYYQLSSRPNISSVAAETEKIIRMRPRVEMMYRLVTKWRSKKHSGLYNVFQDCELVLRSIHLRLPALAEYLARRSEAAHLSMLAWTNS